MWRIDRELPYQIHNPLKTFNPLIGMPKVDEYFQTALRKLYEYSLNFKTSIDLVQRLARHLKLDTFIDTDIQDNQNGITKRLSIAGSLLLIDLDFLEDIRVVKVSLALGNHQTPAELRPPPENGEDVMSDVNNEQRASEQNPNIPKSFITVRDDSGVPLAEQILMNNLADGKLTDFPYNLLYLANLDSLSPPEGDLLLYLDSIGKLLSLIYEKELENKDRRFAEGIASSVGKILYNDVDAQQLGLFLEFWHENHALHTFSENFQLLKHKARLSVQKSTFPTLDYLEDAKKSQWYISSFEEDSLNKVSSIIEEQLPKKHSDIFSPDKNWRLSLDLQQAIFLPRELLEYLGFEDCEIASNQVLQGCYDKINQNGKIDFRTTIDQDQLGISLEFPIIASYVPVSSLILPSLAHITKALPSLRNHIVLSCWLSSLIHNKAVKITDIGEEKTEVTAQKLRESLKLNHEVTEEELLNLNTITESKSYMGMQMIDSNTNTDLEDFVKQEDEISDAANEKPTDDQSTSQLSFIRLCLQEIDYSSPSSDLTFSVSGNKSSGAKLDGQFVLSNGAVKEVKADDVDMDVDNELFIRFIKALSISEDLVSAYELLD